MVDDETNAGSLSRCKVGGNKLSGAARKKKTDKSRGSKWRRRWIAVRRGETVPVNLHSLAYFADPQLIIERPTLPDPPCRLVYIQSISILPFSQEALVFRFSYSSWVWELSISLKN